LGAVSGPGRGSVARALRALERELQAAIDARMRRIGRDGGYQDLRDFGPGLRIERGDIVREFRPDPIITDREVLIRGGRVYDCIRFMYDKGLITYDEWWVAERFRDDLSAAAGASRASDVRFLRQAGISQHWPSEPQLNALWRCQMVWRAIPDELKPITAYVIVGGSSLRAWARLERVRDATASDRLHEALAVLIRCYGKATS
jgi:hypothetical protein